MAVGPDETHGEWAKLLRNAIKRRLATDKDLVPGNRQAASRDPFIEPIHSHGSRNLRMSNHLGRT